MATANYFHLSNLIAPLNTMEEDDYPDMQTLGVRPSIEEIIRKVIEPFYETLSDDSKKSCKASLSYFLTTRSAPFEEIFDHQQDFLLDLSGYEEEFFVLIWKKLFNAEDYHICDPENWSEANDVMASSLKISRR